jgi:hypothetical protein
MQRKSDALTLTSSAPQLKEGQSAENENSDRPHWEEELPYYLYFETNSL